MNIYSERIEALRSMMASKGWDAVIITGSDPHHSEYPAVRWKQVEWLTGFTGEAGDVVVTDSHAGLWTDTRYFIQAAAQLSGTGVELHKTRVPEQILIPEWLRLTFPEGAVIAVDSLCQSAEAVDDLKQAFDVACVPDMLSVLWDGRTPVPQTPIFRINAGESRESKIGWLREAAADAGGCDVTLVSSLDDVAWMLNVRGSDIEYNPLVISYLLVGPDFVRWYVTKDEDTDPGTEATFAALEDEGIAVLPYDSVYGDLGSLSCNSLLIDGGSLNAELRDAIRCQYVSAPSIIAPRKAVKNSFELESMRSVHIDDGIAVEKFLYWLEKSVEADRIITERDAARQLEAYREEIEDYQGDSFEAICAYGPSAALPHYVTPPADAPVLEPHGLFLCDSGGQFLRGTTDITRTVPLGECTEEEMTDYTLVLKGHIGLETAVFPAGTPGCRIDALARMPLWKHGRNFGHGTGHGVGFFLGVHEGPQDMRQNMNGTPLLEGMILSDEPGIYREGKHGIRHENLIECVEAGSTEFGCFLKFKPLTMCHFDTSCIIRDLLTKEETDWLNDYNAQVFDTLSDRLPEGMREWLARKTAKI